MFRARFSYFIRKAFLNIGSHPIIYLLTVTTISITIFIFSAFLLLYINLNTVLKGFEKDVHITVYLLDSVTPEATEVMKRDIASIKEVARVTYISKDDALSYLSEVFGEEQDIIDGLSSNPLPASFEVMLKDEFKNPDDVSLVATKITRMSGIEEVVYAQEWLARFTGLLKIVRLGGVIMGVVFGLAAVTIIANTIKLTFFAREREIEIMKLVGATNAFVKTPMIIEGMIQGLFGAAISVGVLYGLFLFFMERYYQLVAPFFGAGGITFLSPATFTTIIASGMILGILGSLVSFLRMPRVKA